MNIDKEILHKYFAGNTTPEEEVLIMDWAESSPDNYRKYLLERKMWNALLLNYEGTNKWTTETPQKGKKINLWKAISVAASLALLISLSWIQFGIEKPKEGLQAVLVPPGQRVQLILEDGTKVWLNAKSTFTYPTSFGSGIREVSLDGEGFFEVTKNEKKPFVVKTKKYNIKVIGTTFNVYAYSHDASKFETSLLNGSVDVTASSDISNHITLKTKEKASEKDGFLHKGTINNLDRFRWKDGLICLDDEPFESLMRKFSIYYDIQIKIENPKVLDYRCTGKFRQNDGVEYALKVIQKDLKFTYIRNNESNIVIIK